MTDLIDFTITEPTDDTRSSVDLNGQSVLMVASQAKETMSSEAAEKQLEGFYGEQGEWTKGIASLKDKAADLMLRVTRNAADALLVLSGHYPSKKGRKAAGEQYVDWWARAEALGYPFTRKYAERQVRIGAARFIARSHTRTKHLAAELAKRTDGDKQPLIASADVTDTEVLKAALAKLPTKERGEVRKVADDAAKLAANSVLATSDGAGQTRNTSQKVILNGEASAKYIVRSLKYVGEHLATNADSKDKLAVQVGVCDGLTELHSKLPNETVKGVSAFVLASFTKKQKETLLTLMAEREDAEGMDSIAS